MTDWNQVYDLVVSYYELTSRLILIASIHQESIRSVRKDKIRKIFMKLSDRSIEDIENISASEICSTKPLLSCSKNALLEIQ